jgi:hypothetical protein
MGLGNTDHSFAGAHDQGKHVIAYELNPNLPSQKLLAFAESLVGTKPTTLLEASI